MSLYEDDGVFSSSRSNVGKSDVVIPVAGGNASSSSSSSSNQTGNYKCAKYLVPVCRILGVLVGITIAALGVYDIIQNPNFQNIVQNLYRVVFGCLIILAECRIISLLHWFSFLTFFAGLGAFYIFVGGLALGTDTASIVLACVSCGIGILYLIAECAFSEYAKEHRKKLSEEAEADASDVNPFAVASTSTGDANSYRQLDDGETKKKAYDASNPFGAPTEAHAYSESAYGSSRPTSTLSSSTSSARQPAYGGGNDSDSPFASRKAYG